MNKLDLITYRDARDTDLAFIFKSWLLGQFYGNKYGKSGKKDREAPIDYFGSMDRSQFMKWYHKHIETVLAQPDTTVRIACLKEDVDVVLGYSVARGNDLHWVMVKPDWRGIGIARDLIPNGIVNATTITKSGYGIIKKRGWTFSPWGVK